MKGNIGNIMKQAQQLQANMQRAQAEIAQLENPSSEQIAELKAAWQVRHDEVLAAGGLHIIGTERHESRRIDNQLRGRSGRQGDPGSSRFYLSMEDTLMRIFASDRVTGMMKKLGMEEGEAIEHPWVTKAIENAQILEIANIPETFEIVTAVSREINLALAGAQDAETAMKNAQAAAVEILKRGGHLAE